MGFTRLNADLMKKRNVVVDNIFIYEYMPYAPEQYTKVYLFGLAIAQSEDNTIQDIALKLELDENSVISAFYYWKEQGIVSLMTDPFLVEYLPVKPYHAQIKKYSPEKYKSFNDQLHLLIKERLISKTEYDEYYNLMESYHIEDNALLTIIGYCIRLKGKGVSYSYILTVAKSFIAEGCTSFDRVQEKLSEMQIYSDVDLKAVLKCLNAKRSPDHTDSSLLLKWRKSFGFNLETVIHVAKQVKKGGMQTLDMLLCRYHENRLFTREKIDEYNFEREKMYSLTRKIIKTLGLWYDAVDHIIETYVEGWVTMGFSDDTLILIADYCFKRNIKDLEGMNKACAMFFKSGLLTKESIQKHNQAFQAKDNELSLYLSRLGLSRPVSARDREFYATWTDSWKIEKDIILYAAELSKDKASPLAYMNAVLAKIHEKGAKTLDEAKAMSVSFESGANTQNNKTAKRKENTVSRTLTADELNASIATLKDDEL